MEGAEYAASVVMTVQVTEDSLLFFIHHWRSGRR